jgi:hypothetical protein
MRTNPAPHYRAATLAPGIGGARRQDQIAQMNGHCDGVSGEVIEPCGRARTGTAIGRALRITLELEPGGEAPHGWLRAEQRPPCQFDGYVHLISVLESLRSEQPCAGMEGSAR